MCAHSSKYGPPRRGHQASWSLGQLASLQPQLEGSHGDVHARAAPSVSVLYSTGSLAQGLVPSTAK